MVKLYNDKKLIEATIISDNDVFFNRKITARHIDDFGRACMLAIDSAIITDENENIMDTPFGKGVNIDKLSTGVKTVLNISYIIQCKKGVIQDEENCDDMAVDITECGWNALDWVFDLLEKEDNAVRILLRHGEVLNCKDREYLVNESIKVNTAIELASRW